MLALNRDILVILVFLCIIGTGCRNTAGPSDAAHSDEKPTVTLAAVGDVLLARYVGKEIENHGPDYPFEHITGIISSADIAFFNLECTLSTRGVPQRHRYLFRADPRLAENLQKAGFDVACLANNHTLDYGRDAMLDTIEAVEKAGMVAIGAGRDREDALRVRVVEKNRLKVGFIGYSDIPSCGVVRLNDKPTIAGINLDELPEQIRSAKAECDVLVVSFHWGIEYMKRPTERQQEIAKLAIDNGADLILGHHPHVLQPVDTYKNKPIIYSMGGFIWDPILKDTDKSAIYILELAPSSAKLTKTIPIKITKCQPRNAECGVRNRGNMERE